MVKAPDGHEIPCPGTYLEVVPLKKRGYAGDWMSKAEGKPFMTAIITFEDEGGKTRYENPSAFIAMFRTLRGATPRQFLSGANPDVPSHSDPPLVDPFTGEVKKNVHYPNFSGTLATGGGLVFLALLDGTIAAFDDTTLDEVWKINVGSGFSAPPMTFEVNGKQYIAIASGLGGGAKGKLDNTPEMRDQRNATVLYVFAL